MDTRIRKMLALLVAFALVAAMAVGCGGADDGTDDADTGEEPTVDFLAAMVTDVGGLGDKSFNDGSYAGLERAESELGIQIRALESNEIADYEPNIDQLAAANYDVIFTVGFLMTDTTVKKAPEYPDVAFGGIDQFLEDAPTNAAGLIFKEHEGAYMAG
ncbi:MAG: BMP family ABC transporter substrate-binding protein, partial [Coriobacteriia bacterium]|nr:BMP family ABC transporter substrate-binding protein [Coriobacteriia bacterium]